MRSGEKTAIVVGLAAMAFMLLTLQEPPENPPPSVPQPPLPPKPKTEPSPVPPAPPSGRGPNDTDDETALARMLASETEDRAARVVIGWMAITTAKNRAISIYERLTEGEGYGPQRKGKVIRYASTARPPTPQTRDTARRLLSGELVPSARIRAFGHSAWAEREIEDSERSALAMLKRQEKPADFGGIWARLRGTRWYLYNPKAPVVTWRAGAAREALAAVPVLSATDERVA